MQISVLHDAVVGQEIKPLCTLVPGNAGAAAFDIHPLEECKAARS